MTRAIGIPNGHGVDLRGRRKVCYSFLVSAIAALTILAATARAESWIPVGAPGGNVRDLALDPRHPERIYLGTAVGLLYRSDDGGAHWRRLNPGFPLRGNSLDNIVVDPHGVVYIGYWEVRGGGGGIARSDDGGQTFTILKGIQGESVRALAVSPSDPSALVAGSLSGVFLSGDGGKSWSRITAVGDPNLRYIESVAFDPNDPRVIYAGTWHLGWKTVDAGSKWSPMHEGMIDDSDVMTLTVDSRSPESIFATACSGIYRSADAGGKWTKVPGIPYASRRTPAFAQDVQDPALLLAGTTEGLFVSGDDGGAWSRVTPKDLVVNTVISEPGGTILLGTDGAGVLRSKDRGQTWIPSNSGFSERFVSKILFDPDGRRLLAVVWGDTHYGGVFVSPGVRGPWARLAEGLEGREVLSLALEANTILAGTDDGIYARSDDMDSWARVPMFVDGKPMHARVTELLTLSPRRVIAATSKGMLCSPDGGQTWNPCVLGGASEAYALAVSADGVLVTATKSGFFQSADRGETWVQASPPLNATPHELAFVPGADHVLFATTSGGLFRSNDLGASWRRVDGGVPHSDLTGLAVSADGRTIYTSDFTWGGVFRSMDGGDSWARMPTSGLGSDHVWALSIDPTAPGRLLASSSAGGLHVLVNTSTH